MSVSFYLKPTSFCRSNALPFINRNSYSHIRGSKRGHDYTLLDIAVVNNLLSFSRISLATFTYPYQYPSTIFWQREQQPPFQTRPSQHPIYPKDSIYLMTQIVQEIKLEFVPNNWQSLFSFRGFGICPHRNQMEIVRFSIWALQLILLVFPLCPVSWLVSRKQYQSSFTFLTGKFLSGINSI